jgi:hypothetical protein
MSEYGLLVVARHRDGTMVRGRTSDFRPGRALLSVVDEAGAPQRVAIADLKALFFVKSLFGDHSHQQRNTFRYRKDVGKKLWIEFFDGEKLAGWTLSYDPSSGGFFLFPTDPDSNLEKVWVVLGSVVKILTGEQAEAAAAAYERELPQRPQHRGSPDRWDEMLGLRPQDYRRPASADPGQAPAKRSDSGIFLGDW